MKILVVGLLLAGQKYTQGMVEIVIPDRVESPAAHFRRAHHAGIVAIVLRDQVNVPPEFLRLRMNGCAQLLEKCLRGGINNRVDGIEPKRIDVVIVHPLQRVLDEIAPHIVAICIGKINRLSPRRFVKVREIRTEIRQVISFRTQVVVNHIERHCDAMLMAGIYKPL